MGRIQRPSGLSPHQGQLPSAKKSGNIGLAQILDVFAAEDGPEAREFALRLLFEEVCTARPDLIAALMHYGMLIERDMPLDTLVMRHFGRLPDPQP